MIVKNLNKSMLNKDLLVNINFILNDDDKVGLVGPNGTGKTTLLKILSGSLLYDSGNINLNNQTIKLLKQEIEKEYNNDSIIAYIKKENNIFELEKKLNELESNLNENNMEEYGEVLDAYIKMDGYNFENNLQNIMHGLNLNMDLNSKIKTLSGGQKIKVLLISLLMSNADILLLDEPTNNLDIEAIEWLETYLKKLDKKMIIVSHDEVFLNEIVNKIYEINNGNLVEYNLSYNDYLMYKDNEYNRELEKYEQAKDQQKKLKESIQEAKEWANKGLNKKKTDNDKIAANFSKERTKKTSSKAAKLTKELEKIEIDTNFRKREKIDFSVDYVDSKGNKDIYVSNLVCGYDSFKTVPISIDIPFGTRVNVHGKNGTGKSTFIKTLLGENKPLDGKIIIGNEVKIGYISQDSLDGDNINYSIYDYLAQDTEIDKSLLFNILNKFHIDYEDKDKLYNTLSPGQRTRVNLAKLAINEINTLVLDEATNHLDVEAINILEEVIESFNGTIISISHNRKFNDVLNADIYLNIENGNIKNN